ncbi:prolyl 4-hydroxylase subunit alpha-1 [Caerostris extrusa]|uniref:procollagen-proline 4-dioxygenase n=1 Tax=Caerostris extrusa TaxID=172846 RepID=A0AAV4T6E0_CAEEX|nr:prolyl 4-hydroxylase subunit alpha-1 [Caerostris extrusa]
MFYHGEAEVYTSVADLGQLLFTNWEIVRTLGQYLELEEDRLQKVRWLRTQYENLYTTAIQDQESFLYNPVNAYLLVKRLTTDWETTGRLVEAAYSRGLIKNMNNEFLPFPDNEDLKGAANALLRLQDTYLLNSTKLAKGEIEGAKNVYTEFTAGDCFQLGQQAFNTKDNNHTIQWMQEAMVRLEEEVVKTANYQAILEYQALATFRQGKKRRAIELVKEILQMAPNHPRAHGYLAEYEKSLQNSGERSRERSSERNKVDYEYQDYYDYDSDSDSDESNDNTKSFSYTDEDSRSLHSVKTAAIPSFKNYEKLCRGERIQSHLKESKLRCRYTTNNSKYLLLQPVKEEVLSLDPKILMYHDVISDKDVELFRNISLPMLTRANVINPVTGVQEPATYRVSKKDKYHPRVKRASRIVQEVTGLSVDTAEELHVINYGIGGHYEPHLDFKQENEADGFRHLGTGNRIATWIYYLSDVDAGGATVFPKIGVTVKPVKGSAAFWYNLKKSGKGDLNTIHAACPVLVGSKWVGNKWLHEKDNEFRRPCSLNMYE